MVDSLPLAIYQPLGHHQPLGAHSLGVLNLDYFFPTGLPDIDPIEEETPASTKTSLLNRPPSSENAEPQLPPASSPFSYQNFSPVENTLSRSHLSTFTSFPVQRKSSSDDGFSQDNLSILTSTSNDALLSKNIPSQDNRPGNTASGVSLTSDLFATQSFPEIETFVSVPIQSNAEISPENKILPSHTLSKNINPEDSTFKITSSPGEVFPSGNTSPRGFISDSSSSPKKSLVDNSIVQKNSIPNNDVSEHAYPPAIEVNSFFDSTSHVLPKAIVPGSIPDPATLDGESNVVDNDLLYQNVWSGQAFPNTMTSLQSSIEKQEVSVESIPLISDLNVLRSNSDYPSIQRLSFPRSIALENNISEVMLPSVNISQDAQANIFHISKIEQNSESSSNIEGDHGSFSENQSLTTDQPQIFRNFSPEDTIISAQSIQARNVSPVHDPTPLPKTSPTPGTQTHAPLSHEHLPVIIDFSTTPAPLQPLQKVDSSTAEAINLSPDIKGLESSPYTNSQTSEILSKSNLTESGHSPPHSQSISEANVIVSMEAKVERSLAPVTSPQSIEPSPSRAIQRASENNSTTTIVNASNARMRIFNDEALTRSESSSLNNSQGSIQRSESEDLSFSDENLGLPRRSSKAQDLGSENIQKIRDSYSALTTDDSFFSPPRSSDFENISEMGKTFYSEAQDHSERSTRSPINKIFLSAEGDLTSEPSIDFKSPSSAPIQRAREDEAMLPVESVATTSMQPLKTITSHSTENSLPEQPQQEIEVDPTCSTGTVATSRTAALDAEFFTHTDSTLPSQVQRVREKSSLPVRDSESAWIDQDLLSESASQGSKNTSELSTNVTFEPPVEASSPQNSPNFKALIPSKTQEFYENPSTFLVEANPKVNGIDLGEPEQHNSALLSLDRLQRASEDTSGSSIDQTFDLRAAYPPHKITSDIENVTPKQIQKLDEDRAISSTELASEHHLENLVDEPLENIAKVSFDQSQIIREPTPTPLTNAASTSAMTVLAAQAPSPTKEGAHKLIQRVNEDDFASPENTIPKPTIEALSSKIHPGIKTLIPDQIQKFDEAIFTFPENIASDVQSTNLVIDEQPHIEERAPSQMQRASEEINVFSMAIVSTSATTPLTQLSPAIEKARSKQIQKADESSATSSTNIASAHNLENIVDKPLSLEQLSCNQNQSIRGESPTRPADAVPMPAIALDHESFVTAEDVSSKLIQKTGKTNPTFLSNVTSEATAETLSITGKSVIEESTPRQIQKSHESSLTSSTTANLLDHLDRLTHEVSADIEIPLPSQMQRSDAGKNLHLTIIEPWPTTINSDPESITTPENTSLKQIQRTSQESHLPLPIEPVPTKLSPEIKLGIDPTIDLEDSSLSQIQNTVENHVIVPDKNTLISQPTILEPSDLDYGEEKSLRQIQRVDQDHAVLSGETPSITESTTATSQDLAYPEINLKKHVQSAFEDKVDSPTNDLSTSSGIGGELELEEDLRHTSSQRMQRAVQRDYTPSMDSHLESSTSHSIALPTSDFQVLSSNSIYEINELSNSSSANNLSSPVIFSSGFEASSDHQKKLSQDEKDAGYVSSIPAEFLRSALSKEMPLDSQSIFSVESLSACTIQKSHAEELSISTVPSSISFASSISPASILASEEFAPGYSGSIEGLSLKQRQKTHGEDDRISRKTEAPTLSENLTSDSLSNTEEKISDYGQRTTEKYSELLSHSIPAPTTIPVDQPIDVAKSEDKRPSLSVLTTPSSNLWRKVINGSSESSQDSSQAYPVHQPDAETLPPNIIQKIDRNKNIIELEPIASATNLEASSGYLLKPENFALTKSLENNGLEINATDLAYVDANVVQTQSADEHLDHHRVIHEKSKFLSNWPESLNSPQTVGFHPDTTNYEALPVVIDFQTSPGSLQTKPEIKQQQVIEYSSSIDSLIHREIETSPSLGYDYNIDQNRDLLAVMDITKKQNYLDIASPQSLPRTTLTMSSQPDFSSVVHYPEISHAAQTSATDPGSMKQLWSSKKAASDVSQVIQFPEVDEVRIQRLANDDNSGFPLEWQNLADLVASQTQKYSVTPERLTQDQLTWNGTGTTSVEEVIETSQNPSTMPLVTSAPPSPAPIQRKLSISRSKPVLKCHNNHSSIQAQSSSEDDSLTPSVLIQAKEDAPFTTIEANQNYGSKDQSRKSLVLEQLAQEMYHRMRQRLMLEKERSGRLYDKRF